MMFKYDVISTAQKNHAKIMSDFDESAVSLAHLKWFIEEREAIRNGKQTDDPVLKHSKFCNIRREHDKTTQFIHSTLSGLDGVTLWQNLMLSRFINRIDTLRTVIPWNGKDLSYLLESPFTNPYAYQLSSSLVKTRRWDTVREIIVYDVPTKADCTWEAANLFRTPGSAAKATNLAFGKGAEFVFYQIVLDYAQMRGVWDLTSDDIITGTGSKVIAPMIDTSSLNMLPYEIENVLCEYRKYLYQSKRLADGRKLSSPYIPGRYL